MENDELFNMNYSYFCCIVDKCMKVRLQLLEDQKQKMAALRHAIKGGLDSGIVEDFDPDAYLEEMKARKQLYR